MNKSDLREMCSPEDWYTCNILPRVKVH